MNSVVENREGVPAFDEEFVLMLKISGPQTIEQICLASGMDWPRAFMAADRLSRCGVVTLRMAGRGQYRISLPGAAV